MEESPIYQQYVVGKNADEILKPHTAVNTNYAPYLQTAAKIQADREITEKQIEASDRLVNALNQAAASSDRSSQKIYWLTVFVAVSGAAQAIATAWPYLAWFFHH